MPTNTATNQGMTEREALAYRMRNRGRLPRMKNKRRALKESRKKLLQARVERALRDLYHNATPKYPTAKNEFEESEFKSWFQGYCESEIDYLQSGGAYGDLDSTCKFILTQYKSERAGQYAVKKYHRQAALERDTPAAAWELIGEFGKLYTYGRGGRTLAPDKLMNRYGPSSRVNHDYFVETTKASAAVITRAIRIIESFNYFVNTWNESIPEVWESEKQEMDLQDKIDAHDFVKRVTGYGYA